MAWVFRTYVSSSGRSDVQKQINVLAPTVLLHFLTRVRYLANTSKADWHEPQAKKLSGTEDIYEIRFKSAIQYRPLGFFGPGSSEFTILVWASKKGSVWTPSGAIESAAQRRKAILKGEASCAALQIDGEEFPPTEQ